MDELDHIPPHSNEMERAVLGAMIIDREALDYVIMHIKQETFYKPINQAVFRALKMLWDEETAIDQLTLAEKLSNLGLLNSIGGEPAIAGLMNETWSAANIKYHCDELLEKERLRKIIALCASATSYVYKGQHEANLILHQLSNKFDKIIDSAKSKKAQPMEYVVQEGYALIAQKMEAPDGLVGLPTGYSLLDNITGGWQKGDMIVLAGRPSMGKTSLAFEMAVRTASKGHPVGIFSLETTCRKIGMRMISTKARHSVSNLHQVKDKLVSATVLGDAANYLNKLPIWVDDAATATIDEIRAHAKRMQKSHGIELLIIDYLQMVAGNPGDQIRKQITDISKGTKAMGKILDIPVIILSQLRRAQPGKEYVAPILSELKEAGGIEENADIVLFIHDPSEEWKREYLDRHGIPYQAEDLKTKRQIRVAKNRDGPKVVTLFNWHGSYYGFDEISTSQIDDLERG